MGIYINDGEIDQIFTKGRPVVAVYINGLKIWPADISPIINEIFSCYYNGYWIDEYPWTDDTPWTD